MTAHHRTDHYIPERHLSGFLAPFWPLVCQAVKIHDQWPLPGPKNVRSGHPETLSEDETEHWINVLNAVRRGEKVQLFEGLSMRITPSPQEQDQAYAMILRMGELTRPERAVVFACARGRPFWKLNNARWDMLETALIRMVCAEPMGAAV